MQPRRIVDDNTVLCLGDGTCEVAVLLALLVVVKMPPSSSSRQSTASGVMMPFRRVIFSRWLMSVSYAPDDFDGDMFKGDVPCWSVG